MNKTNAVLMGAVVGVAVVYALLVLIFTLVDVIDANFVINFDPFSITDGSLIPEALQDMYWSLVNVFTSENEYVTVLLLTVGLLFVLFGCMSPTTRDMRGKESDPKEYLFTSQPMAFVKCLLVPWNSFLFLWSKKKIPVIIPIIFFPFILPFAVIMDIIMIPLFVIVKLVMELRIKLAASKDRQIYDRDTQYAICPKCKREFYKPNIKCKCGLVVSYPSPDAHGISYHTCNKGHKIPCTNADGARSKLQAVCPHCNKEIKTRDAKPIVVSMVGAVGAGKTTLMISGVEGICAVAKEKGIVTEIATDKISPEAQKTKSHVTPTSPGELDSEYFFMRSRDLSEKEVLINDISGIEFEPDQDKILFEEYYRYNDGIIFAIDPLIVMAIHNSMSPTKGSKTTPVVTLESFYHMFTEINGYGPNVRSTVPFAVVLTKMDDPRVKSAVDAEGAGEAFLKKYGQESFVKIVKSAFQNVKYFKVASLGENVNAAEPFKWIITENDKDLKSRLL